MKLPAYLYRDTEELHRYFALLTQLLRDAIGENGFQISPITTADENVLKSYQFKPILPAGTIFFVTDAGANGEWHGIQVTADPDTMTNAQLVSFDVTAIP